MLQGFRIQCRSFSDLIEGRHLSQLQVSADISARLRAFVNADIFKTRSLAAKSEYWLTLDQLAHLSDSSIPPNRMAEFPWNTNNKVVVHEISKLSRLVQLDGVSIRLEQIRK